MVEEPRRMLAPWTVEESESTFVVRTANGFVVSVTYFDDDPARDFNLRKQEARRIAVAISRLPELREIDEERPDRETVIADLMQGQFSDPVRVIAFNTAERWSRDCQFRAANTRTLM